MPSARELLRFLRKLGYQEIRQKGSHRILKHSDRPMLSVPMHSGDVPRGLFLRILKDAGFSEEDFVGDKKKGKA
jgi:predicted RNA binding protein YcfA (HicA-like mRNA interferase family)